MRNQKNFFILPFFLTSLTLFSSACGPTFKAVNTEASTLRSSSNFQAATALINSSCVSCHGNFRNYTEEDWVKNGYVSAGSPKTSLLYTKLKGVTPEGNMPTSGALSEADKLVLETWISELTVNGPAPGESNAIERRQKALSILQKSCTVCHGVAVTATSGDYKGASVPAFGKTGTFSDDNSFVLSGLIEPGFPAQSWLIRSLAGGDIATMPQGNINSLSVTDREVLELWILKINE